MASLIAFDSSVGSSFARRSVSRIGTVHIRAAHILLLLPTVQNQTIVFSEIGCAITIIQSCSRPVVHVARDTLIQIINQRGTILSYIASHSAPQALILVLCTHSRLFITCHLSSEVHIRGDHLFISNCRLIQVDISSRVKVSLRFELVVMGIKVASRPLDLLRVLLLTPCLRKVHLILLNRVEFVASETSR